MDSNTFTVYGSHFNLQEIKEPKFIVANIILVKVATQHIRSLSVCCLQNGFRSSLQESKTSKPFPKLHKFFSLKPSARSSKLNYQRSRISGQFCNAIGRDKKQLFYKSWPIRLTPRLSQGISLRWNSNMCLPACHEMWNNGALSAETAQKLILGKYFSVHCHVHSTSCLHFWAWIELVN